MPDLLADMAMPGAACCLDMRNALGDKRLTIRAPRLALLYTTSHLSRLSSPLFQRLSLNRLP